MSLDDIVIRRDGVQSRVASWLQAQGHKTIDDGPTEFQPPRVIISRAGLGAKVVSKAERELQDRVDKKLAKVLKPANAEPEVPQTVPEEEVKEEESRTGHTTGALSYAAMLANIKAGCPSKKKKRKKPDNTPMPNPVQGMDSGTLVGVAEATEPNAPIQCLQLEGVGVLSKSQLKKQRRRQRLSQGARETVEIPAT